MTPTVCHIYVTFVAIAQDVCHVFVTNKVIAAGSMPRIYIRYMQNARRFTALFSNIPTFRQVLRVPQPIAFYLVHLDSAEYHNNIHSQEKTWWCWALERVQYSCSYFQRFIVKMTSDCLALTVPNRHNSVGVSSKPKLRTC